jgi:UDPglucose 6-dehydrogenase
MKNEAILIVSSQSPVGLCRSLRSLLKSSNPTIDLAYSPENLRLGDAIRHYLNPGRIILGTTNTKTQRKCRALFSHIPAEILSMNLESAEMVKHGINSFLAVSIVLANHLADICENTGANIDDVVAGMKSDTRIGMKAYLSPGIGFSGGTLGRDLQVLRQRNIEAMGDAVLFGMIHELNALRKHTIIKKLEHILGSFNGKSIGVLGLTYKPGTSTLRRSLPMEITQILVAKGAKVTVHDPKADYNEIGGASLFSTTENIEEAARQADALVLLTEWRNFKEFDWKNVPEMMSRPVFFDTKNFLDKSVMKKLGFEYYSIGR